MVKKALLISAVAALASTGAMAVTISGATISKDGKVVSVAHRSTNYIAPAPAPKGMTTIFSDIGSAYPNSLYFCCYGAGVYGSQSIFQSQNWTAMQFTSSKNATVSEIDLAIEYGTGTNQVTVGLYRDNGGVPGKKIADTDITNLPPAGGCCGIAVFKVKAKVKAGTPYWVTMTTENANDSYMFWNGNTTDQIHLVPIAYNTGTGWYSGGGYAPAPTFAVYGK